MYSSFTSEESRTVFAFFISHHKRNSRHFYFSVDVVVRVDSNSELQLKRVSRLKYTSILVNRGLVLWESVSWKCPKSAFNRSVYQLNGLIQTLENCESKLLPRGGRVRSRTVIHSSDGVLMGTSHYIVDGVKWSTLTSYPLVVANSIAPLKRGWNLCVFHSFIIPFPISIRLMTYIRRKLGIVPSPRAYMGGEFRIFLNPRAFISGESYIRRLGPPVLLSSNSQSLYMGWSSKLF